MCYQPSTRYSCGHSRRDGEIKTCRRFKSVKQSCWSAFGAAFTGKPATHCGRLENIGMVPGDSVCDACRFDQTKVRGGSSCGPDYSAGSSSRPREAPPQMRPSRRDNVQAAPQAARRVNPLEGQTSTQRSRRGPPPVAMENIHPALRDHPAFRDAGDGDDQPIQRSRSNSSSQHRHRHRDATHSSSHRTRSASRPAGRTRPSSNPTRGRGHHHHTREATSAIPREDVHSTYKGPREPPTAPLIRPDTPPGIPFPAVKHATREEMRENLRMDNPALRRQAREERKQAERDFKQLEKDAAHLGKDRERATRKRAATDFDKKAEKIREKALAKANARKDEKIFIGNSSRDKEHRTRPQQSDARAATDRRKNATTPPVEMATALARMFSGNEIETPLVSPVAGPSTVQAKYVKKVVAVKQPKIHHPSSSSAAPVPRKEVRAKPDKYGKHSSMTADKDQQNTKKEKRSWLAGLREAPSVESFVCKDAREIEQGIRR